MANPFTTVQVSKPSASWFKLSHDHKFTMNMGDLVPTLLQEVLPGDIFKMRSENLIRFAPMVAPAMHSIAVYNHYFFVPNRLVWSNWEKFITANNGESIVPAPPMFNMNGYVEEGSLADYLGLPRGESASGIGQISAIPFAGYQLIFNEYYRDQNLVTAIPSALSDGLNAWGSPPMSILRKRAWQHDYFTSALPFAQKGGAVTLPLGTLQDVPVYRQKDDASPIDSFAWSSDPAGEMAIMRNFNGSGQNEHIYAKTSELTADAATINDLRRAFRLQEWLEKMARGGSRYTEQLLVHFNVRSSDQRLNRPEFIGGTKNPVIISEVLQTSESADTPQATMAGHGISASGGSNMTYKAEEHGYIFCIQSVMPTTAYQQGIPRHWNRTSHLDYAWPTFAHIGEQAVLNKEIYSDRDDDLDEEVFGYIPRYSEYRYNPSRVSGEFKTTLAFWHLGRIFENRPNLNQDFITCNPRNDIFAVTDESHKLWCHTFHKMKAYRKLPKYGTPTL